MMSLAGSLNPKRIIGLAPYVFALVSCAVAWVRTRKSKQPTRLAATLTVLEAALLLDMILNGRWLLHDLLANLAMANNLYAKRSGPQHVALGLLGISVALGIGLAVRHFRGRPGACLAACGGILSVCSWCVEIISLHSVDSLLYHSVNGVTQVRVVWTVCSLMTGVGILWNTSTRRVDAASDRSLAEARQAP